MRIALPYGHDTLEADLDCGRLLGVLDIADAPAVSNLEGALRAVFDRPIGLDSPLHSIIAPGASVIILVSDAFRQTGADRILPYLIDEIGRAGVPEESIAFLFATGTHRAPNPEEQARILGPELLARFQDRVFMHNPYDEAGLAHIGTTSRGTPVKINRHAFEADHIIATGAVVLHYFGGYGGGRKSIVPGIAGVETIARNHARNLHPRENRLDPAVRIGVLDGNPVAEDMLEAASMCKVDFILNTVLNRQGAIAGVFGGALDAAHRAAAAFARKLFAVPISAQADLVIASAGNAQNFIQSHKALFNAFQAMRPGGRILLLARCPEGLGSPGFRRWLELGTREAIIADLRKNADINGQTALSTLEKGASTLFISDLSGQEVRALGGRKMNTLAEALDLVRGELASENPSWYLMPSASYTVPFYGCAHPAEVGR